MSPSRVQRDHADGQKLFEFLAERDPLGDFPDFINLHSSEVANESAHVHLAD